LLNSNFVGLELLAGAGAQCLSVPEQQQTFTSLMFENQQPLQLTLEPEADLLPLFLQVGLDEDTARACMASHRNQSLVYYRSSAAATFGVNGVPTLFINGERHQGALDFASVAATIESTLEGLQ